MSTSRIEELKKRREMERDKHRVDVRRPNTQIKYALILLGILLFLGVLFVRRDELYLWIWPIGILLGFSMERSRFCFAASLRNPFTLGTTGLLKAVIVSLMISSVGFFVLQQLSIGGETYLVEELPGMIRPFGIHTVIGGLMFGLGMVVAGGCASGTLMRVGEGFTLQIFVLGGFIMGAVVAGLWHEDFWRNLLFHGGWTVYLPDFVGFYPALFLQLAILGILYILVNQIKLKV